MIVEWARDRRDDSIVEWARDRGDDSIVEWDRDSVEGWGAFLRSIFLKFPTEYY